MGNSVLGVPLPCGCFPCMCCSARPQTGCASTYSPCQLHLRTAICSPYAPTGEIYLLGRHGSRGLWNNYLALRAWNASMVAPGPSSGHRPLVAANPPLYQLLQVRVLDDPRDPPSLGNRPALDLFDVHGHVDGRRSGYVASHSESISARGSQLGDLFRTQAA